MKFDVTDSRLDENHTLHRMKIIHFSEKIRENSTLRYIFIKKMITFVVETLSESIIASEKRFKIAKNELCIKHYYKIPHYELCIVNYAFK